MTASQASEMMAHLRSKYLRELPMRRARLNTLLEELAKAGLTTSTHDALLFLAHNLVGSGGSYGLPELSETAGVLEEALRSTPPERQTVEHCLRDLIACCDSILSAAEAEDIDFVDAADVPIGRIGPLPTILVVDDDRDIRWLLSSLLSSIASVVTARTALEALEIMERRHPDLVLLDDKMPGQLSGIDLLERIAVTPGINKIPVIMVTANNKPAAVMRGLKNGATDYLVKPLSPQLVLDRVKKHLALRLATVMIVDDDPAVRVLLERRFRSLGCRVVVAEDGEQALSLMRDQLPNLVLLDYTMPGMDGAAVLETMQQERALSRVPVIFLTARHQKKDIMGALYSGAADYIIKPFKSDEVVSRSMRLLSGLRTSL